MYLYMYLGKLTHESSKRVGHLEGILVLLKKLDKGKY